MTSPTRILAGFLKDVLWLRIEGKGSHEVSHALDCFVTRRMAEGTHHLVVDLEDCPGMDSTFIGTLTGIAVRLMESPTGRLQVVNLNQRNSQVLENLGVDQIFEVDHQGQAWRPERQAISQAVHHNICQQMAPLERDERCRMMLDAHENLSKIQEANVPVFKDVIECLRSQLETVPA